MIFKEEFKKEMVRKLLLPGSRGATVLSTEIGVCPQTLYIGRCPTDGWRDKFAEINSLVGTSAKSPRNWKPEARLKAIFDTGALDELELGRWLRENGLQKDHLEMWKKEIMDTTKSNKFRGEIRELKKENLALKKELGRKDKALAEVSALPVGRQRLLILKKKAAQKARWPSLLFQQDEQYIASESTVYRVLDKAKLLGHRSESRPKHRREKPKELKANGPNQVLSWDITWLHTDVKGLYFYLYLFMDVWSRKIVGWGIHETQTPDIASVMITEICSRLNIKSINLHSDNGGPMKGATMLATMQNLGVIPSFSRPSVSNDNPYSESLFKTMKYKVTYPGYFSDIDSAKIWVSYFIIWYNEEHQGRPTRLPWHSGIKYVTPEERHSGQDKIILASRNQTYLIAKKKHPERWAGNTRNWNWIENVVLNPDKKKDLLANAA